MTTEAELSGAQHHSLDMGEAGPERQSFTAAGCFQLHAGHVFALLSIT